MNNPIDFIKNALKSNVNPKNLIGKLIPGNNQILQKLVNDADSGNVESIKQFANNLFKQNGRDFEKEYGEFMKNFK